MLDAYRTGDGVSWDELGDHAREGQSDANRPWFEHQLADALTSVEDLHERLARPGVRVLDLGCGGGWSSIALSRAYPGAAIHGVDIDAPSVSMAAENARAAGVADQVRFRLREYAGAAGSGEFEVLPIADFSFFRFYRLS